MAVWFTAAVTQLQSCRSSAWVVGGLCCSPGAFSGGLLVAHDSSALHFCGPMGSLWGPAVVLWGSCGGPTVARLLGSRGQVPGSCSGCASLLICICGSFSGWFVTPGSFTGAPHHLLIAIQPQQLSLARNYPALPAPSHHSSAMLIASLFYHTHFFALRSSRSTLDCVEHCVEQ